MVRRGGKRALESAGVVDAGVVLVRLVLQRRSHAVATKLLDRCARGELSLSISVVNLAEVLQHTRRYTQATGLDVVVLLRGYRVAFHSPDVRIARDVAILASAADLSIADRFAIATATALKARVYTTDGVLARALEDRRLPVTLL